MICKIVKHDFRCIMRVLMSDLYSSSTTNYLESKIFWSRCAKEVFGRTSPDVF